jgi:hypothetical protein
LNRTLLTLVLCLSLFRFFPVIGQRAPAEVAEQFLRDKLTTSQNLAGFHLEKPLKHGNIWIFESLDPAGFVLVKEEKHCTVVGYSTANRFTRNNLIPAPALAFLESLSGGTVPAEDPERMKSGFQPVGPLIRTTWSQEGFFNFYCPEDPDGPDNHVYAGCAAVAMGQILRYYGKFNDFQLTAEHNDNEYGKLTAVIGNYDWNRMENRPITIDPEVSRLLFGLGVLTRMNFRPSGSSTSNFNVYDAFKKLKYYNAIRMVRATTTSEVWTGNFHQNIASCQPVYVSGSGHSFVCDGIDAQGLFHFNLGWYGYGDGYYPLNGIMGIFPSEAIFDLRPYSNNLPPVKLTLDTADGARVLKWEKHPMATVDPDYYRVYLNDTISYETHVTTVNTYSFPPGNHELMVTASYPQGESPWIGPIQLRIEGNAVDIPDENLRIALLEELIRENIPLENNSPTVNQLLKVQKLDITEPIGTLTGLEHCHNLQVLNIESETGHGLDLGPVTLLKRLKSLTLKNIDYHSIERIAKNDRLIHLELNRIPAGDLSFLENLPQLLTLRLIDFPVTDTRIFSNLQTIKWLTISGCNLPNFAFIQSMTNLEYIDLSRNQLTRFRLTGDLPELNDLDISYNNINELFFLECIPNIFKLNLNNNQINRFITGSNLKYLQELSLDNNSIDSVWTSLPMPALRDLSINRNNIRSVRLLKDFAPGLIRLDLGGNQIREFWDGSLQSLEYLNLSNNRINLLNAVTNNPLLKHIDLSGNAVADLYPIFDHTAGNGLQYIDLTGNPLSEESLSDFAPSLSNTIDTLLLPDTPQESSPGYPQPKRNLAVTGQSTVLSWQTSNISSSSFYEVYAGYSPTQMVLAGIATEPAFPMEISPGQRYFWRVRTVLPDTSFFGGLYSFVTTRPISLPYKEGFEEYPALGFLTEWSDAWIKSIPSASASTDGRIDASRRYEGKQALKLLNASDLRLPLNHLYQSTLYISMQMLVGDGCIATVRLNDLSGTSMEFYFKSNKKCDLVINNKLISEITYPSGEWFMMSIKLFSKGNEIWVKAGSNEFSVPWKFSGSIANAGELEIASAPGRFWPTDGQPLFYIDNLEIRASGSVGTGIIPNPDGIRVYPIPAREEIMIEVPEENGPLNILMADLSGRIMETGIISTGPGKWEADIRHMLPGIYLIRLSGQGIDRTVKILITR